MASGVRRGKAPVQRKLAAGMPKTPKELEEFIKGVVNESVGRSNPVSTPEGSGERVTVQAIAPKHRLLNAIAVDRDVLARSTEVFDDKDAALEWIFEPNSALNGKTPHEMSLNA